MWKSILKRTAMVGAFVLLAATAVVVGINFWERPPKAEREFLAMRWEILQPPPNGQPRKNRQQRDEEIATRCLAIADKYPQSTGELAALFFADHQLQSCELREPISTRLAARIENASIQEIDRTTGYGLPGAISADVAAPRLLARVKQDLSNPTAPRILSAIAGAIGSGSESKHPPALFREIADIIAERFSDSSGIYNFCSTLGNGMYSPPWAYQFETHVRRILDVSTDRFVRLNASMAIADIVKSFPERQSESESLYKDLIANFDGTVAYHAQGLEEQYRHAALQRLEEMQFAPIGKHVPEIVGIDLAGESMQLSDHRGKVVVLSFWATWCGPCMKLIPHERELANKFPSDQLTIVGVNADKDPDHALQVSLEKSMSWRSFRDKQADGTRISERWNALFPTVYLIDRNGILRHRFTGNPTPAALEESVRKLLEQDQIASNP